MRFLIQTKTLAVILLLRLLLLLLIMLILRILFLILLVLLPRFEELHLMTSIGRPKTSNTLGPS